MRDRWTVLARVVIEQERLRVQRTWLWGWRPAGPRCCSTSRPRARRWSRGPRPGMALEASLAFHPSATPLRALLADPGPVEPAPGSFGAGGAGEALRTVAVRRRREPMARRVAGGAALGGAGRP